MPKVSIIVPVYGVEKYIERCARSLFEQTLDDIEYLFIDDCTPDRSIEILKSVLEEYPNRKDQVIIHRMEKNSGQAAVRKWGMMNATGDYVIHCDSDDWVDVDMYRTMYEKAVEDDADVVVCNYVETNSQSVSKRTKGYCNQTYQGFILDLMYRRVSWALWNKLVKRNLIDNIVCYPSKNLGEDMLLLFQMLKGTEKVMFVSGYYYYYFINPVSITHVDTVEKSVLNFTQAKENYDSVIDYLTQSPTKEEARAIKYMKYFQKSRLLPYFSNKEVRSLYYSCYNDCEWSVVCNTLLPMKDRIQCLLAKLRIYGFLKTITKRIELW